VNSESESAPKLGTDGVAKVISQQVEHFQTAEVWGLDKGAAGAIGHMVCHD